jgi:serine/threonine protein kinase
LQLATELAVLQHLHHESLVGFLFIADEGARLSIFMDWAGQGLRELVEGQQRQPLGEDAARFIACQLTNSLVYLHNKVIQAVYNKQLCGQHGLHCLGRAEPAIVQHTAVVHPAHVTQQLVLMCMHCIMQPVAIVMQPMSAPKAYQTDMVSSTL